MKNYILLYEGGDPDWHANTPADEMQAEMAKWGVWMETLSAKGQLVSGGDPLHNGGTRLDANGVATDIGAAEFKDLVSGYSIISAVNIEDAIAIGKTCPVFSDASVTVQIREVLEME